MFMKLCTTDGNALINTRCISAIVSDPAFKDTVMIHTIDGKSYEISGSFTELENLLDVREP